MTKLINKPKHIKNVEKKITMVQRLQNSIITRWVWKYWQHEETGRICMLPFWKSPGKRYYKCKYKT